MSEQLQAFVKEYKRPAIFQWPARSNSINCFNNTEV